MLSVVEFASHRAADFLMPDLKKMGEVNSPCRDSLLAYCNSAISGCISSTKEDKVFLCLPLVLVEEAGVRASCSRRVGRGSSRSGHHSCNPWVGSGIGDRSRDSGWLSHSRRVLLVAVPAKVVVADADTALGRQHAWQGKLRQRSSHKR